MSSIEEIAESFTCAFYSHEWEGVKAPTIHKLSIKEAYEVQDLVAEMRVRRGETVVGYKVGCTSAAIRSQFGLQEPIYGRLFRPHVFEDHVGLNWDDYLNCAIEPEMVLVMGKDLFGKDLSDEELAGGIEYVSPGIELHNFKFWHAPPSLQELICSGGIHAGLVVGTPKISPSTLRFKDELFSVYEEHRLVSSAPASEIMGGPLSSLRWLVNALTIQGIPLKEGCMVIPGSPVELLSIKKSMHLKVDIKKIGPVSVHFKNRITPAKDHS